MKKLLAVAAILVIAGCIVFASAMAVNGWDFTKLGTYAYETNTHILEETFRNISINTDTADIFFTTSNDGKCSVVCHEYENEKHAVTVENDTLTIAAVDSGKWYTHIGITTRTPAITVYLPQSQYAALQIDESTGDITIPAEFTFDTVAISVSTADIECMASATSLLQINASTGDIEVEGISAGALELGVTTGEISAAGVTCQGDMTIKVTTGKAEIADTTCKNLISHGNTGEIFLQNVIAAEKFHIERSTGDVILYKCDAAELFVETDTGDVRGSLLTDKVYVVQTDTGVIDVPGTTTGGKCQITTDTGDIKIKAE